MGREIKRVPLDFDWPIREVWEGFINPYYEAVDCAYCGGSGLSPIAKLWSDKWYGKAQFSPRETGSKLFDPQDPYIQQINREKLDRSNDLTWWMNWLGAQTLDEAVWRESLRMCNHWNTAWCHHLDQDDVQVLFDEGRLFNFGDPQTCPSASEVNRLSLTGMGHDSINQWVCLRARIARMGESLECIHCEDGRVWPSSEAKLRYENWKKSPPPTGEGWQVWETVSEGSPISPVLATDEELVNWLIQEGYSEGAAEQFAKTGWVPSAVGMVKGDSYILRSDIETLNMPKSE